MATADRDAPAPPETVPEPVPETGEEGVAGAPAGPLTAIPPSPAPRRLLSRDGPSGRALTAALGIALIVGLVLLLSTAGAWAGASPPSPRPASPSPAPVAAATPSRTVTPMPTTAPATSPGSTPTDSPSPRNAEPAQSPLSAPVKPQPGHVFGHGDTSRPVVYITIDDCRNWANIERDLLLANAAGIELTLFPAGKYIDADKAEASRVLLEAVSFGDEIGNHTYTHSLLNTGSMIDIKADLDAQLAAVRTALNDKTYREWFVRPPYGSWLDNPGFGNSAVTDGLAIAMWSDDSKGYQSGSTVPFVLQNVFAPKHFKNGAIILLHDDDTDTAAFQAIIDGIRSAGYSVGGALKNILPRAAPAAANIGLPAVPAPFDDMAIRERRPLVPGSQAELCLGLSTRACANPQPIITTYPVW